MDNGGSTVNSRRCGVTEAAHHGDERTTLLGMLQRQRDLVVWKLKVASDQVLNVVATPSGMILHWLVHHLITSWCRGAREVARSW